jgi:putative Holliday junction resolvase
MPESETVMAFDFGEKRIGVAIGETLLAAARPLATIEAEANEHRFAAIGWHFPNIPAITQQYKTTI